MLDVVEGVNATVLLVSAVICLLVYYILKCELAARGLPPGVRGLAVIPVLVRGAKKGLVTEGQTLLHKYGSIASLQLFHLRTMIFIGTHELLQLAFRKAELSDRPRARVLLNRGLIRSNGRLWKEQRRFALATLRDFGMGKIALEEKILHEIGELISEFLKYKEPFNVKYPVGCAISNIICSVVFSSRYDYSDPTAELFLRCFNENTSTPKTSLVNIIPGSRFIPGLRGAYMKITKNRETVMEIVRQSVAEHKKTFNGSDVRDYIDAYIAAQEQRKDLTDSTFTDLQLVDSVFDLFAAGSETTGTSLRWALALMALNPDVQTKVQRELDDNVAPHRLPNMTDKNKLIQMEAVLMEVQRYGSVVPAVGRSANEETELGGYRIRPGYLVVASIHKLHTDPAVWPHPDTFNLANFLDDNGQIINRDFLVPFGVGKRSCLGESLAKMEMYLFFAAFMQKFTFSFLPGTEPDLTKPELGIIRSPPDYKIVATPRRQQ